jgi:carbon-monoxide dehydrogenase small subunit
MQIQLKINGKDTSVDVAPNTLLVQLLREHLNMTGTHVGCDTAQCGACTVMKDGHAVKSCNMLAAQAQGADTRCKRRSKSATACNAAFAHRAWC